ncbi:MAG: hypothetical protein ACI9FG_001794 [Crocinitomicaceae bacterium]|jgi:hypothetical protein
MYVNKIVDQARGSWVIYKNKYDIMLLFCFTYVLVVLTRVRYE